MTNHPSRGRRAALLREVVRAVRDCASGKSDPITLDAKDCNALIVQLDRIPTLEIHARRPSLDRAAP